MNNINNNEYNAIIDTIKNITDVVMVLTTKINSQEDEINKLKKNNLFLEENINKLKKNIQNLKIKSTSIANAELNTDDENLMTEYVNDTRDTKNTKNTMDNSETHNTQSNSSSETNKIMTDPTTIRDTEIEKLKKNKAIQLVGKLIEKKKEINNLIKNKEKDDEEKNEKDEEVVVKQNVINKRKNKIMRRF